MDVFGPAKRSEIMRRVRSEGTRPEVAVRKLVSSLGFRYRLHSKALLGHPDLVFSRLHKVIFVHGCFWHGHSCSGGELPSSNQAYWRTKRAKNVNRDRRIRRELHRLGWKSLLVWERQIRRERTGNLPLTRRAESVFESSVARIIPQLRDP